MSRGGGGAALAGLSAGTIISELGTIAYYAGGALTLFFFQAIARIVRQEGLATSIKILTWIYFSFVAVYLLMRCGIPLLASLLIGTAASGGGRAVGNAFGAVGLLAVVATFLLIVLGLTCLIWYIVVLFQVRGAITQRIGR
jgi:hypothetical protein